MITNEIRKQIEVVRLSGKSNMLDWISVQRTAFEMELYELVALIEEQKDEYIQYIFYGGKQND